MAEKHSSTGCVYLARNKVNGKGYVGKTIRTLSSRKRRHIADAKCGRAVCRVFHAAIMKHGPSAFQWSILYRSDNENDLFKKEAEYIKRLNTKSPNGYNLADGGSGGNTGCKYSDESREKMSAWQRGRKRPAEIFNDDYRKKQSLIQTGKKRPWSPEARRRHKQRCAAKRGQPGRPQSAAEKIKRSETMKTSSAVAAARQASIGRPNPGTSQAMAKKWAESRREYLDKIYAELKQHPDRIGLIGDRKPGGLRRAIV